MLCVNGEQLFPSAVLLLVLRCIHVESVLRDNSKVTFHRPPYFGGKGTIKIKDKEKTRSKHMKGSKERSLLKQIFVKLRSKMTKKEMKSLTTYLVLVELVLFVVVVLVSKQRETKPS